MNSPTSCLLRHAALPDQGAPTLELTAMHWRRASSADRGRPLSSVRLTSRERTHESQQRDEPISGVTAEAIEKRCRQPLLIDRRHEGGARSSPERCRREALTPPAL